MLGVVPAHQGLGPDDALVGQRDQRLEVDLDLAAVPRAWCSAVSRSSRPAERPPIRSTSNSVTWPPRPRSLARYMATSASCKRSSREVPASLNAMPMLMVATTSWPPLSRMRLTQRLEHPVGHLAGILGRAHALEDDHELVAAETRQGVTRPDGTPEALGDDAEQLVADLVTEVVVDDLEPIDVAEEHGHPAAGAVGLEQRVVEVVEEQAAVGQAGQGILERMPGQLLLEGLALRGVPEHDDRGRGLCVADHRRRGHGHREI